MKTEIMKVKGDWQEVVDDCRATVAKPPLGHEPSGEWKTAILIASRSATSGSSGSGAGSNIGSRCTGKPTSGPAG